MKPGQIKFFFQEIKAWMIGGYHCINWDVMSRERKQLNDTENTHIIKYFNNWLNTGQYNGLFGNQLECSGRGHKEELQLQMFQCYHSKVWST